MDEVAWFGFQTESEWAERGGVLRGARSADLVVVRVEEAAAGVRGGEVCGCADTSAAAPIATGRSDSCRAGFAPAEKPCLCTDLDSIRLV